MGKKKMRQEQDNSPVLSDEEMAQSSVNKQAKKSKRKKKRDEDEEDDIARELELMQLEESGVVVKESNTNSKSQDTKKSGKKSEERNGEKVETLPQKAESHKNESNDLDCEEDKVEAAPKAKKNKKQKKKEAEAMEEDQGKDKDNPAAEEVKNVSPENPDEENAGQGKKKRKGKLSAEAKQKLKEEEEKKKEEEGKKGKKGINKKFLEAMRIQQQKMKEEEEARRLEEEELERLEDERIKQAEEKKRLAEEKKAKKKQKDKERKDKLKAEGLYLNAKQKADKKKAEEMVALLKAQGMSVPDAGSKKPALPKLGSKSHQKRKQLQQQQQNKKEEEKKAEKELSAQMEEKKKSPPPEDDGIKDAWDISSDEEESQETPTNETEKTSSENTADELSETESEDEVDLREKVLKRLRQRKENCDNNRSLDNLRAPVVCVLGHVDHGKTKILDKLRRTNVQEGEVGGITQQIGATNVPAEGIMKQTKMVKSFDPSSLKFPGLLIIDTPGHESFSNLRQRGSSLCDIAILVVDITQGLEPQTIESMGLLQKKNVPFVVALNKVDMIYEWESNQHKDIREVIANQSTAAKNDFDRRTDEIKLKLTEQGLNVSMFWENPDPNEYIDLIPTSAITGDGMGNLISLICEKCQNNLASSLMYSEALQCVVLEVKTIVGYGTTVDVILVNGRLKEGDTLVLAGTDGVIVTQIRSLLLPKPMKEIRVKGSYDEFKEVKAAQGIKIAAKDLDKAIAGINARVAVNDDEVEILKEAVAQDLAKTMRSMKLHDKGVYVQASTLGALEALLDFFKVQKIPYSGIRVGPVVKRDVMKAAAMLEHEEKYAVILAFDVRVERDAQELADREGVRIFTEETIYHLGDRYVEYLEEYKKQKQEENRAVAVFPCKLSIKPDCVFNKRDPIVIGVTVDQGVLRSGTVLCVPAKEFVEIGVVTSMEDNHKAVDIAKKGVEVCIKIDPSQGTTPKLFGRHFDGTDVIVSKISRESINACKEFFRDDLTKADWKLMSELKKLFEIL